MITKYIENKYALKSKSTVKLNPYQVTLMPDKVSVAFDEHFTKLHVYFHK